MLPEEQAVSNLQKPYSMSHGLAALPDTGWEVCGGGYVKQMIKHAAFSRKPLVLWREGTSSARGAA